MARTAWRSHRTSQNKNLASPRNWLTRDGNTGAMKSPIPTTYQKIVNRRKYEGRS